MISDQQTNETNETNGTNEDILVLFLTREEVETLHDITVALKEMTKQRLRDLASRTNEDVRLRHIADITHEISHLAVLASKLERVMEDD